MKFYLSIFILGIVFNAVSYAQKEWYLDEVQKAIENRTENEKKLSTNLFATITRMNIAISKGKSLAEVMNMYTSEAIFIDPQNRFRILIRFKTAGKGEIDSVKREILENGGAIHSDARPGHNGYIEIRAWLAFDKIFALSLYPGVGLIEELYKPGSR